MTSALAALSARDFTEQVIVEAEAFSKQLEQRFPGMSATDDGIAYDLPRATQTMKEWRP